MAKRVSRYRVPGTVMATLVGRVGEAIVNLSNSSIHVHDGVTQGGFELARADAENIQDATSSQAGRMTTAQVIELTAATATGAANAANIATNAGLIATNASDIATNTAAIAANDVDIAALQADVATNTADIATNAADITTNTANIATNTANVSSALANAASADANANTRLPKISATSNRALMAASSGAAVAASTVNLNGTYTTGSKIDAFPNGSVSRLIVWSATAPIGWSVNTSITDYALRLTSSSGGSTGGSVNFSSAFNTTANHGINSTGAHQHGPGTFTPTGIPSATVDLLNSSFGSGTAVAAFNSTHAITGLTASNGNHTHTHNHNVRYMNILRIQKSS